MKIFKNIVQIIIISMAIVPCFSYDYTFDTQCMYLIGGDSDKSEPYKFDLAYNDTSKNKNVKFMTTNFCKNAYVMKCSDSSDGAYIRDYFDASQSVFLSILCNSVGEGSNYYNEDDDYLKKSSFLDFYIIDSATGYLEPCHPYGTMNSCDYAYNLPLIFNKIMNDFFGIKQARNLGVNKIEESFEPDKAANSFSTGHFPGLNLQEGLSNGICDPESEYYKTTCKSLKGYMSDALSLLKSTEVINVEGLQTKEGIDCENDFKSNILYCGLLGSNSDYKFINTVYNEYFWYNLFLSYYSFYIDGSDYLDGTIKDVADRLEENKEKRFLVQDQILKSKQAITTSIKTLGEITYSFPIHIGFLMYQEDAKLFMEKVGKLYAPIRTLYDKLRNVQIKES